MKLFKCKSTIQQDEKQCNEIYTVDGGALILKNLNPGDRRTCKTSKNYKYNKHNIYTRKILHAVPTQANMCNVLNYFQVCFGLKSLAIVV